MIRRELAGDNGAVLQFADADRRVEAFADEIDEAVGQVEVEFYVWEAAEESADMRRDVEAAERCRRGDLELAVRLGVAAADKILRFFDEAQNIDDALEVALAGLGGV